jgi:hypothetical protein
VARAYALQARTSQGANAARTRALAAYKDLPGNAKHFSGEQRVGTIFILLCCLRRTVISVMQAAESEMRRLFATRSAGGQRFIVTSSRLTGAISGLDAGGYAVLKKISVYDAPFHARNYTMDVMGPKIKGPMQRALSPDGSLLAILDNESVYVFQLPPLKRRAGSAEFHAF